MRIGSLAASVLVLSSASARAQTTFDDVHPIYRTRCADCHSTQGNGGFDMAAADIESAYADTQLASYFVPGAAKGFATLVRIRNGDMPLGAGCSGDPALDGGNPACTTAAEQALLDAWIQGGQLGPRPLTGTPFCFGDGSGTPCPCGNVGAADGGCANTVSWSGGKLVAAGAASLAADTLVLRATRIPDGSSLYFQGTQAAANGAGVVFGDGLRCAAGSVVRIGTQASSAGASQYPEPGDAAISVRGSIAGAGEVRRYQTWYRNAASYCTPATWNLTNGVTVTWGT